MLRNRRFLHVLNLTFFILLIFSHLYLTSLKKTEQKLKSFDHCHRKNISGDDDKFYSNIIHIVKLNILYCEIPKAASTNLRRLIYGYLNEQDSLGNLDRKSIWIDYKDYFKQFYLTKDLQHVFQDRNLFKFLVVRHPFRRIYSVYYDKFVNNHIDDTLSGWKQLEEDILVQMNINQTLLTIRRNDIKLDFRTFLLYIVDSIRKNRSINNHWEQIVQRCGLCYINYDWIGKTENFDYDGKFLINKLNGNSNKIHLEFPSKDFDKKSQEKQQTLLNDPELVELFRNTIKNDHDFRVLIEYYKPDFQMFKYVMPNA